jgi:hypothetical protein
MCYKRADGSGAAEPLRFLQFQVAYLRSNAPSSIDVREFAAVFVFRRSRCSTIRRVVRADS